MTKTIMIKNLKMKECDEFKDFLVFDKSLPHLVLMAKAAKLLHAAKYAKRYGRPYDKN